MENDRTRVEIGTVDEIGWKTMIEIKIFIIYDYMYLYNTSLCSRNVNVHFFGSL